MERLRVPCIADVARDGVFHAVAVANTQSCIRGNFHRVARVFLHFRLRISLNIGTSTSRLQLRRQLRLLLFPQNRVIRVPQDLLNLPRLGVDRLHLFFQHVRRVLAVHS